MFALWRCKERPIVAFEEIVFDPQAAGAFTLKFKIAGGRTGGRFDRQDRPGGSIVLDVTYSDPMPDGLPFAALRSMYAMQTMKRRRRLRLAHQARQYLGKRRR